MENSVEPDQLTSLKPADLGLHCFCCGFFALHPSQQFFSLARMIPGLNQN